MNATEQPVSNGERDTGATGIDHENDTPERSMTEYDQPPHESDEHDHLLNAETRRALQRNGRAAQRVGAGILALVPFWGVVFVAGWMSVMVPVAVGVVLACSIAAPVTTVYVVIRAGGQSHAETVQTVKQTVRRLGARDVPPATEDTTTGGHA
jgi:hypothetical protein